MTEYMYIHYNHMIFTNEYTSLETPGHIYRSVIRDKVHFMPKCPEVECSWHDFTILIHSL